MLCSSASSGSSYADLIDEVLWSLGNPIGSSDHRRCARLPSRARALVAPAMQQEQMRLVQMRDVGGRGVCLLAARPLAVNSIAFLQFTDAPRMSIECQVRHCRRLNESQHLIGVEFQNFHARPA